MPTLLVVDDERSVRHVFCRVFEGEDMTVLTAGTAGEALDLIDRHRPDTVVLDILLPDKSGLEVFREVHGRDPKLPVILITAGGTSETAIEAMKLGAFDYLLKPLDFAKVRSLVNRAFAVRRLMCEPVGLGSDSDQVPRGADILVGRSGPMQEIYKAIGRVAPQTVTALIRGESGTGKELVARAIYQHSNRAAGPFLVVNCAAIPETLLESELFGHEKGSFTGADRRRIGKFEQCSGGTLFLDEIGDMPLAIQSKILRVLQDQRFERVGGNQTVQSDVRIIAATNRDLESMVAHGSFRSDLYYRLNVYTIALPPLRERCDDLPLLIEHFLAKANHELGKQVRSVSPETAARLAEYLWPGNVRELQSVIRRAVLQSTGPMLLPDFLPAELCATRSEYGIAKLPSSEATTDWERFVDKCIEQGSETMYDEALDLMERQVITRVLRRTAGNQVRAAKVLGITRTTLRTKLRQLGISVERAVHEGEQPGEDEPEASSG